MQDADWTDLPHAMSPEVHVVLYAVTYYLLHLT